MNSINKASVVHPLLIFFCLIAFFSPHQFVPVAQIEKDNAQKTLTSSQQENIEYNKALGEREREKRVEE